MVGKNGVAPKVRQELDALDHSLDKHYETTKIEVEEEEVVKGDDGKVKSRTVHYVEKDLVYVKDLTGLLYTAQNIFIPHYMQSN